MKESELLMDYSDIKPNQSNCDLRKIIMWTIFLIPIIFFITLVSIIIIKYPENIALEPSIVGIWVVKFDGIIDILWNITAEYQFQYMLNGELSPSFTNITKYNKNDTHVSDFVYNLKNDKVYFYRLVLIYDYKKYISNQIKFTTLKVPVIGINTNNSKIEPRSIICNAYINNTGSHILNYFFKYRKINEIVFNKTTKYPIVNAFGLNIINQKIVNLSSNTWYEFQISIIENYSTYVYDSNSVYIFIL